MTRRSVAAVDSANLTRAPLMGWGSVAPPSHCLAPCALDALCSGESVSASVTQSATIRATRKHARASSRGPPSGARPAIIAIAGKRKAVGSREYGARGAFGNGDTRPIIRLGLSSGHHGSLSPPARLPPSSRLADVGGDREQHRRVGARRVRIHVVDPVSERAVRAAGSDPEQRRLPQ